MRPNLEPGCGRTAELQKVSLYSNIRPKYTRMFTTLHAAFVRFELFSYQASECKKSLVQNLCCDPRCRRSRASPSLESGFSAGFQGIYEAMCIAFGASLRQDLWRERFSKHQAVTRGTKSCLEGRHVSVTQGHPRQGMWSRMVTDNFFRSCKGRLTNLLWDALGSWQERGRSIIHLSKACSFLRRVLTRSLASLRLQICPGLQSRLRLRLPAPGIPGPGLKQSFDALRHRFGARAIAHGLKIIGIPHMFAMEDELMASSASPVSPRASSSAASLRFAELRSSVQEIPASCMYLLLSGIRISAVLQGLSVSKVGHPVLKKRMALL